MEEQPEVKIAPGGLNKIILDLRDQGYEVVGPVLRDGAIVYDEVESLADLPQGWTDEQDAASYRLVKRSDNAYFGYVVGPHSWKKYLLPPVQRLLQATRSQNGLSIQPVVPEEKKFAFLGVRSCELHAIQIQDKIFLSDHYQDPHYKKVRENTLLIAINCTQAASTCFCTSMNTGPAVSFGYDIALTEVLDTDEHFFLLRAGSEQGQNILESVDHSEAQAHEQDLAQQRIQEAAVQMTRRVDTEGLKELLYNNLEHSRWDDVASRCLACTNCTMVCPTCFCTSVEDTSSLDGKTATREKKWDSCFSMDFSYIHGGNVRRSLKSRYRQWLTHKFASWIDQFGTSGCVGCGRCITWCPAGIDVTEELRAIGNAETP